MVQPHICIYQCAVIAKRCLQSNIICQKVAKILEVYMQTNFQANSKRTGVIHPSGQAQRYSCSELYNKKGGVKH